jgi:hypothetical protein
MVRGRNVCQGGRAVGLPLPRDRSVRAGHRRTGVRETGQTATRRFFTRALQHGSRPSEVSTDRAPAYPRVLDELLPSACHVMERYGNNPIESDRVRSWTAQVPTQVDAWSQTAPLGSRDQCWTRIRPEHPPRALRTQHEARPTASAPSGLRQTIPRHLIEAPHRSAIPASPQRNNAP